MGSSPDPTDTERGEPSRSLFVSDLHLHEREDAASVVGTVEAYVQEYEVDALLSGGDVGEAEHIDALMGVDAPVRRGVAGNHDAGYEEGVAADGGDVRYGDAVAWEVGGFTVGMVHDPRDAALRGTKDRFQQPPEECYDIVLHGHSHYPYDRVVEGVEEPYTVDCERPLAVGGGALSENYNVSEALPDRSMHLIEVYDGAVTVQHRDFDTGELVEAAAYRYEPGEGFVEAAAWTAWDGDRFVG